MPSCVERPIASMGLLFGRLPCCARSEILLELSTKLTDVVA